MQTDQTATYNAHVLMYPARFSFGLVGRVDRVRCLSDFSLLCDVRSAMLTEDWFDSTKFNMTHKSNTQLWDVFTGATVSSKLTRTGTVTLFNDSVSVVLPFNKSNMMLPEPVMRAFQCSYDGISKFRNLSFKVALHFNVACVKGSTGSIIANFFNGDFSWQEACLKQSFSDPTTTMTVLRESTALNKLSLQERLQSQSHLSL